MVFNLAFQMKCKYMTYNIIFYTSLVKSDHMFFIQDTHALLTFLLLEELFQSEFCGYTNFTFHFNEEHVCLPNERSSVIGSIWCLWNQSNRSPTFSKDFYQMKVKSYNTCDISHFMQAKSSLLFQNKEIIDI